MSDKEFSIRHQLIQLRRDRNRLERIKERTDDDLSETRVAIKSLKSALVEIEMEKKAKLIASMKKPKARKKAAPTKPKIKRPVAPRVAEAEKEGEQISEAKIDASSMTAVEDSVEVEVEEKKPVAPKYRKKENDKTNSE